MATVKSGTESSVAWCKALLDGAEAHGREEGPDATIGDLEAFFQAAFLLLAPSKMYKFWSDDEVAGIVRGLPEYQGLSQGVYGESDCGDVLDGADAGPG